MRSVFNAPETGMVVSLSVRRQANARRMTDKKRNPQILFEVSDMLTDRRLCHAQFFARTGETAETAAASKAARAFNGGVSNIRKTYPEM